jgi:hypothetical protein
MRQNASTWVRVAGKMVVGVVGVVLTHVHNGAECSIGVTSGQQIEFKIWAVTVFYNQ